MCSIERELNSSARTSSCLSECRSVFGIYCVCLHAHRVWMLIVMMCTHVDLVCVVLLPPRAAVAKCRMKPVDIVHLVVHLQVIDGNLFSRVTHDLSIFRPTKQGLTYVTLMDADSYTASRLYSTLPPTMISSRGRTLAPVNVCACTAA